MLRQGLLIVGGYLLVFSLLGMIFPFRASGQAPDPRFTEKAAARDAALALKRGAHTESPQLFEYDLIYQKMEWEVDPAVRYISGRITSRFLSQVPRLDKVCFNLKANMTVDSVKGRGDHLHFSLENDLLGIDLPEPLEKGAADSVTVWYRGIPEASGFGSFAVSSHAGVPVLWTLSEPYGAYEWWPCKQSLADKIDSTDIVVTTPAQYRTASNGVLTGEWVDQELRTMHWRHRYPIATYLVAIAVTNYAEYADTLRLGENRSMPVVHFVYPEYMATARTKSPVTLELLALYNRLFGEYPFAREKYGHAQFGWGGGMEHQTMSFMGNLEFELVAHELAHSWYGNSITLASWHDIWLNEGFATYATGLAYEHFFGGMYWKTWRTNTLKNILKQPDGSVYVADTALVYRVFDSRLSYNKGAYLLHMLRWITGDTAFFSAMRSYSADPAVKFGFATPGIFTGHLEAASGISLAEFFNDWYYGEGYPLYSATWQVKEPGWLEVSLTQQPVHSSVSFFEMPVPVRFYAPGRRDSADFRLDHRHNGQLFHLPLSFTPEEMVIDPDLWLVRGVSKVTGSEEVKTNQTFSLFPNPFDQAFTISLPPGAECMRVTLSDMAGRTVFENRGEALTLNPAIPPGTYILRVVTLDESYVWKLVKNASRAAAVR